MSDPQYDSLPPADPHERVARIVYASRATLAGPVYAEMERIRASALRHNPPLGIHTALLHQSGWFLQWKEGPAGAIEALMARIAHDSRHAGLRTVHASAGPRLLAGPWSMAIVQCQDSHHDFGRRVEQLVAEHAAGRQASPPAAWRRLSTPAHHPGAQRQDEPGAFARLLVCSAQGTGAFALVDWLARRAGRPVVHRRYAGARDLDVGTDYLDLATSAGLVRVIAMARRGLALPLTRAFLPDTGHLALLLSGEPQADLALLRRLAGACAGAATPPVLLGVGAQPGVHAPLGALAAGLGLRYRPLVADGAQPHAAWRALAAAVLHAA